VIYLLILIGVLLAPFTTHAACTGGSPTWTSTSDNASMVSCIGSATSGDTINVSGSGSTAWTWTSTKALLIHGPGKASLTITGGFTYAPTTGEATKTFELDGFTVSGSAVFQATAPGSANPIRGLKIHDNEFSGAHSPVRAIYWLGLEWGVFYNNVFRDNGIHFSVIGAERAGWDAGVPAFGSADYLYMENNTFQESFGNDFVWEIGQGGRLVFRHNTITDTPSGGGSEVLDIHGKQPGGIHPTVSTEVYHNTITTTSDNFRWLHHRAGQAIIANNTFDDASHSAAFNFTEYKAWGGNSSCEPYPVLAYAAGPEGQIHNAYYWNNKVAGVTSNPTYSDESGGIHCGNPKPDGVHEASGFIVLNREYWKPSSGLDASRPATCTADGNTFYGATDTDKLYKCTSTNVWSTFFTPYAYPHPLRGSLALPTPKFFHRRVQP
jgi:hypothetical protein